MVPAGNKANRTNKKIQVFNFYTFLVKNES